MKLPNSDKAIISRDKLIDYILSKTHTTGKFKAKFFHKLGFKKTNVHLLKEELLKLAKFQGVIDIVSSEFGTKYIVDGEIDTPSGRVVNIRTIWIIEKWENRPRFVTVYPV